MSCVIKPKEYSEILVDLISSDPKYLSYDNVARFILESDLSDLQQKMALHNIGLLFKDLSSVEGGEIYNLGHSTHILKNIVNFDQPSYLKDIRSMYAIKPGGKSKLEELNSRIQALAGPLVLHEEVRTLLLDISNYIDNISFSDPADRVALAEEFKNKMLAATNFMQNPLKDMSIRSIVTAFDKYSGAARYVSQRTIDGVGDKTLVVFKDGREILVPTANVLSEEAKSNVAYTTNGPYGKVIKMNTIKHPMDIGSFMSVFNAKPLDRSDKYQNPLFEFLNRLSELDTENVKFTLVRNQGVADEMLSVMKNKALSDTSYTSLANRNHITYETQLQEQHLAANPKNQVIAYRRPTAAEMPFNIVMEVTYFDKANVKKSEKVFLHPHTLLTFVSGDNTTIPVDFNNPNHISLLYSLLTTRTGYNQTRVPEESEIDTLRAGALYFQSFMKDITAKYENEIATQNEIDITDEFIESFDGGGRRSVTTKTSLDKAIEKDTTISVEVELIPTGITKDKKSITKRVPFLYALNTNTGNSSSATSYTLMTNTQGYAIKYIDPTIEDPDEAEQIFANLQELAEYLGITEDYIVDTFGTKNQHLLIKLDATNRPNGFYGLAREVKPGADFTTFGELLTDLIDAVNTVNKIAPDQLSAKASEFNKKVRFEVYSPPIQKISRGYLFNVNFASSIANPNNFRIELRLNKNYKNNTELQKRIKDYEALNSDKQLNTEINISEIIKMLSNKITSEMREHLITEYPLLFQDINSVDKYMNAVSQALKVMQDNNSTDPKDVEVMNAFADFQDSVNKYIIKQFLNGINKLKTSNPELYHLLEEDYSFDGVFRPDFIIAGISELSGKQNLKLKYKNQANATAYRANYSNYVYLESDAKKFMIKPKSAYNRSTKQADHIIPQEPRTAKPKASNVSKSAPVNKKQVAELKQNVEPVVSKPEVEPVKDADQTPYTEKTNTTPRSLPPGFEAPFSIESQFITADGDVIQEQINLVKSILPIFDIIQEDLSEVLSDMSNDSSVLGYYKDAVIYLNSKLNASGTVYHEAFHGVFRHIYDNTRRTELLNQVKNNNKYKNRFTPKAIQEFLTSRNYQMSDSEAVDLIAEEILAEGFKSYMLNNTKPKGIIQKLYKLLSDLIRMFINRRSDIETEYYKISKGSYAESTLAKNYTNHKPAYEIIPGLNVVYIDKQTKAVAVRKYAMTAEEQSTLINVLTSYMLEYQGETTDIEVIFEKAITYAFTEYFNVNKLLAKATTQKQRNTIIEKYGAMYDNFNFVMGLRSRYNINDLNFTDNEGYTGSFENSVKDITGASVNNFEGQYSKMLLKREVFKQYKKSFFGTKYLDEVQRSADEYFKSILNYDSEQKDDVDIEETTEERKLFDDDFTNKNPLDGLSAEIRRFIGTIKYDVYDPEVDMSVPSVLDADKVFYMMIMISTNLETNEIIPNLLTKAAIYEQDGYYDEAGALRAVYDKINRLCELDSDFKPTKNENLYNMLVDVLYKTELDIRMVNTTISEYYVEGSEEVNEYFNYTIKDQVLNADLEASKNSFISKHLQFINKVKSSRQSPATLKKSIDKLKQVTDKYFKQSAHDLGENSSAIIVGVTPQQAEQRLTNVAKQVKTALDELGFELPLSFIKFSIIATDFKNRKLDPGMYEKANEFNFIKSMLDTHMSLIGSNNYLEPKFFLDLVKNLTSTKGPLVYDENSVPVAFNPDYKDLFSSETVKTGKRKYGKESTTIMGSVIPIYKRASLYLVKNTPTIVPSTVRNSENKNIYRFLNHTPITLMVKDLKKKGIAALQKDPNYRFLDTFLNANRFFKTDQFKVFLENFEAVLYGGLTQRIKDDYADGKTVKHIDGNSLNALSLLFFLKRKRVQGSIKDEFGNYKQIDMITYDRRFSQLESSGTSYLMTSFYETYADFNGLARTESGRLKIVPVLYNAVEQDFARITESFKNSQAIKTEYEQFLENPQSTEYRNNLRLDYNVKDRQGVPDVDDPKLRAYNFTKLSDFFEGPYGDTFREELKSLAKQGKEISTYKRLQEMLNALNAYAKDQLEKHESRLIKAGLFTETVTVNAEIVDGQFVSKKYIVITTNALPDRIKTDFEAEDLKAVYGGGAMVDFDDEDAPIKYSTVIPNYRNLIADEFFNNWSNALQVNDLFLGDKALIVKDDTDEIKRNKKFLSTNSNHKEGYFKQATVAPIYAYIDKANYMLPPFYSIEEARIYFTENASQYSEEFVEETISKVEAAFANPKLLKEVFDGQAVTTILYEMSRNKKIGRLPASVKKVMLTAAVRKLTNDEINKLAEYKVTLNSKKPVTAGLTKYTKDSEMFLDRSSLAYFSPVMDPVRNTLYTLQDMEIVMGQIYGIYEQREDALIDGNFDTARKLELEMANLYDIIHQNYKPYPTRERLYKLLVSMEKNGVDVLTDPSSEKNSKIYPAYSNPEGYYPTLNVSSDYIPNSYKFEQVETSGHSEKAKVGIQLKALLPADLANIKEIAEQHVKAGGPEITESETVAMAYLAQALQQFNQTNATSTEARRVFYDYISGKNSKGDNAMIISLYEVITQSLLEIGADERTLEYFTVKDGRPVFNANLPFIRSLLESYFFAEYSNNITDEKVAGGKYFHVSPYGYDVFYNINDGKTITSEKWLKLSDNEKALYKTRPLGVSIDETVNEKGETIKVYTFEAILPIPNMSDRELKFFMDKMKYMMGTRIPTEDKRSMVVIKVVDYVPAHQINTVMVPYLYHILAGSDFDIDSLYLRHLAKYRSLKDNQLKIYGERESTEDAYYEYLDKITHNKSIRNIMNSERRNSRLGSAIMQDKTLIDFLTLVNYSEEEIESLKTVFEVVNNMTFDEIRTQLSDTMDYYLSEGNRYYTDIYLPFLQDYKYKRSKGELTEELVQERKTHLQKMKKDYNNPFLINRDYKNLITRFIEDYILVKSLQRYTLPVTPEQFENFKDKDLLVPEVYQNNNLKASISILSNESVFKRLYINEESSTKFMSDFAAKYGYTIESQKIELNSSTQAAQNQAKDSSDSFKDGIGITANMNKFMALASAFNLTLNDKNIIWKFLNSAKEEQSFSEFGRLNVKNQRVISLVGNVLGGFADAVKSPVPVLLKLNEYNTNVTLSMLGVGLDPEMVFAMNYLPGIGKALNATREQSRAFKTDMYDNARNFTSNLANQTKNLLYTYLPDGTKTPTVYNQLMALGVLDKAIKSPTINNSFKSDRVILEYTPPADTVDKNILKEKIDSLNVTPADLGFTVKFIDNNGNVVNATSQEASYYLTHMYYKQARQSQDLLGAGAIVNLYKRLKGNFEDFGNLRRNIKTFLSDKGIFTNTSVNNIKNSVNAYKVLADLVEEIETTAGQYFLDKTTFFSPFVDLFSSVTRNTRTISDSIVTELGLRTYVLSKLERAFELELKAGLRPAERLELADLQNFKEIFTDPDFWFTADLESELKEMQFKYKGNRFLQALTTSVGSELAIDQLLEETEQRVKLQETFVVLSPAIRLSPEVKKQLIQDLEALKNKEPLYVRKLMYMELARTGARNVNKTFLSLYSLSDYKEVSDNLIQALETVKDVENDTSLTTKEDQILELFKRLYKENGTKRLSELYTKTLMEIAGDPLNRKIKNFSKVNITEDGPILSQLKDLYKDSSNDMLLEALSQFAVGDDKKDFVTIGKRRGRKIFKQNNTETITFSFTDVFDKKKSKLKDFATSVFSSLNIKIGEKSVEFPEIINIDGVFYALRDVNKDHKMLEQKDPYQRFIDIISKENPSVNRTALYVRLPKNFTIGNLKAGAFDLNYIEEYNKLTDKKYDVFLDQEGRLMKIPIENEVGENEVETIDDSEDNVYDYMDEIDETDDIISAMFESDENTTTESGVNEGIFSFTADDLFTSSSNFSLSFGLENENYSVDLDTGVVTNSDGSEVKNVKLKDMLMTYAAKLKQGYTMEQLNDLDYKSLNLDNLNVVKQLFENRANRNIDIKKYHKELLKFVSQLDENMSTEEKLDKIKCI